MRASLCFALAITGMDIGIAHAQLRPTPGPGDPRIQSVAYDANQVVQLQVPVNYQLTVEFAPDEQIENVAVGDSGAWQVTANKRGDHLFIKPVRDGVTTNLTVITDARSYAFELRTEYGAGADTAYTVRFTYPVAAASMQPMPPAESGRYRITGSKAIRPIRMDDDGQKTRIEWAPDSPLPAVYAVDERGREQLLDSNMRDGIFVIDRVVPRLIFRFDGKFASAIRLKPRRGE